MNEETQITDEIDAGNDAEFWRQARFYLREADEADEAERRESELESSPERIAEMKQLLERFAASDDDEFTD